MPIITHGVNNPSRGGCWFAVPQWASVMHLHYTSYKIISKRMEKIPQHNELDGGS